MTETQDCRQALKRMAIQVTALLPEDERAALAVLAYTHDMVTGFLGEGARRGKGDVIALDRRR